MNVLHNEVHVFAVVVGLEVLDDVGMVETVQDGDLLHDAIDVVPELVLVEDLDGDLEVFLELVGRHENSTEGANSENFSFVVDDIVLLELMNTLLFSAFVDIDLLSLHLTALVILALAVG